MDCKEALERIEEKADGALPKDREAELSSHLAACGTCAAEDDAVCAAGPALRALAALHSERKAAGLDAMWTRVRAGIEEGEKSRGVPGWVARWAWIPAVAALAALALLFYPTGTDQSPFHPSTFDVSVEDVESEAATVALVDKGEDLPRVIWIIEDGKT
jgi:anti-sigma factor RsiW